MQQMASILRDAAYELLMAVDRLEDHPGVASDHAQRAKASRKPGGRGLSCGPGRPFQRRRGYPARDQDDEIARGLSPLEQCGRPWRRGGQCYRRYYCQDHLRAGRICVTDPYCHRHFGARVCIPEWQKRFEQHCRDDDFVARLIPARRPGNNSRGGISGAFYFWDCGGEDDRPWDCPGQK